MAIEFLDEFIYSSREAALPLIRSDLQLTYVQIGLLLSIPNVIGNLVEMVLGILADLGYRRPLILGGSVSYALSALLRALSPSFGLFFGSETLSSPSSGAFVSLAQSALMDLDPARQEQNMARWTLAGSVGVLSGPLILALAAILGLGWRGLFVILSGLIILLGIFVWKTPGLGSTINHAHPGLDGPRALWWGIVDAFRSLRRWDVVRWLVLLQFSDLMLDVLYGFLAIYFTDVVGLPPVTAGAAIAIWSGVGLLGDFLVLPLLERVRGLDYLRFSVWVELFLYPAFLLAPWLPAKLVLVGLIGLFNSGWYSILQGNLYGSMPGRSGTVLTLNNVIGVVGHLIPLAIGMAAQRLGLSAAMWLLLAGPVVLLIGLPRKI